MKGTVNNFMYSPFTKSTTAEIVLEGNQCAELEKHKGKHVDMCLKRYSKKRSLNANNYAWLLIGQIAMENNLPSVEVYQNYIKQVGIYRDVDIAAEAENALKTVWQAYGLGWLAERVDSGENEEMVTLRLYYGSSMYSQRQMARLIDNIVQDCEALGINTKTPAEIADMISLWKTEPKVTRNEG